MATMEFLNEIPMNKRSMLDQSLGRFQSVRFGLPELVKNSKDHYSRLGITAPAERVIVVLASSDERRLGVLDFGGASREDFQAWQTWADPDANRGTSAHDIEGGHGNGGKGFMVRGATEDSSFESCRDGLRTKMGFSNSVSERQYYPGYFTEDGSPVDNKKVKNVQLLLEQALEQFGAKLDSLPEVATVAFAKRKAFSVVQLNSVKDWAGRRSVVRHQIADVPAELLAHPQAAWTIETCGVFFVIDGKLHSKTPLVRAEIAPLPGFEDLPPIPIPIQLPDPRTGEMVATGAPSALAESAAVVEPKLTSLEHGLQGLKHHLQLKTSLKLLRSPGGKQLNVVRVRNAKNVVGNWSIADLQPQPSSGYIYGTLMALSLGAEHQVGADRVNLADVPLVRALEHWTAAQVGELAARIQKALAKEQKPEEVEKANDGLRQMREAMRQFLADLTKGQGGRGPEEGDVGPPPPTRGTVVRQLVLEGGAQSIALAKGTSVPLLVKGYDVSESGQKLLVPNPNLELHSDPPNFVTLDGKRILRAGNAGRTTIWFRDVSSGTESNHVEVEVITATGAEVREIPSRLLLQGETVPLRVSFHTAKGARKDLLVDARADLLIDAEVDEPLMGRVDRWGAFTAGAHEGNATVRVRYGAAASETVVAVLHVGPEKISPKPRTGADSGPDVPVILLCGQEAPNMEQYPVEQRTFPPSEQAPTIIDYEPPFAPATIFINHQSRESLQVQRGRSGRRAAAPIGSEVFLQFLAMKCFEILKRLYVQQTVSDDKITELQFRERLGEAEIECAPFIDQAFEIAATLRDHE